jgi:hypothetical protein
MFGLHLIIHCKQAADVIRNISAEHGNRDDST